MTTRKNRIYEIAYNKPPAGGTAQSRVVFRSDQGDNLTSYTYIRPVKSIYIFEDGSSTPRVEYRIDSQLKIETSDACADWNRAGEPNWDTATRVINSIQQLSGIDADPTTVDVPNGSNGVYALPATTFDTIKKAHHIENGEQLLLLPLHRWKSTMDMAVCLPLFTHRMAV